MTIEQVDEALTAAREAYLKALTSGGVTEYSINGRSVRRATSKELREEITYLESLKASLQGNSFSLSVLRDG